MTQASERTDLDYRTSGFAPIELDQPDEDVTAGTISLVLDIFNGGGEKCADMNSIDLAHPKLSAEQQVFAYQFALNEIILPIQAQLEEVLVKARLKNK